MANRSIIPGRGPLQISGRNGFFIDSTGARLIIRAFGENRFHMDSNGIFTEQKVQNYIGGTHQAGIEEPGAADETALMLRMDGTLQRVTVGADDSGGTGFRYLRVPNAPP